MKNKKLNFLFILCLFLIFLFVICSIYVYGIVNTDYKLDDVEIQCLFESEQNLLNNIIIDMKPENFISMPNNVVDDDIIEVVDAKVSESLNNLEIKEFEEEFFVNNKLSFRNIENDVGSCEESIEEKYYRIFGENYINKMGHCEYYENGEEDALKDMVGFYIQVWSLDENNEWYQRRVYMQTHKNIEKTVKCIFTDLLDLPEEDRLPIETIGCYNYRTGSSCHTCGVAIDINWVQNAEMTLSGVVTAGSYWKPYEDIYSITPDSKVVEIFQKYGFGWGGNWVNKKDYMHFSYFNR